MNTEYVPECKQLQATYKVENKFLSGPRIAKICLQQETPIRVTIHQEGIRTITVVAEKDISVQVLYSILINMEELLMIFDGKFIKLYNLCFSKSDKNTERDLEKWSLQYKIRRPTYFTSSKFYEYNGNKLIEFDEVLTTKIFEEWERLLEDLDIVHKMFMYSICNSGLTVDVKCAFLVEQAEPLVEILKYRKQLFPSLNPGKTPLKCCLGALISTYGKEIFKEELKSVYEEFLQTLVDSRVRIMHIKRCQDKKYLDGKQSVLYSVKMYLLYRCIILDILEVDESVYYDKLCKCVKGWNEWNGVLHSFLISCKNKL